MAVGNALRGVPSHRYARNATEGVPYTWNHAPLFRSTSLRGWCCLLMGATTTQSVVPGLSSSAEVALEVRGDRPGVAISPHGVAIEQHAAARRAPAQ